MTRRGQFFLIAALIITTILVGLATMYTSTKTQQQQEKVYDLSNEINFETNKVIDYGIFNASSQTEISQKIETFTQIYSQANPDSDILIVYGNKGDITGKLYSATSTGSLTLGTGGGQTGISTTTLSEKPISTTVEGGKVKVQLSTGESYEFDIKEGQAFYLVIKKVSANEQFVATK